MATGRLSLAQQIAQLEEAAPVDYDPEDIQSHGMEADDDVNGDPAAGREHYVDLGPSSLRKMHDSIADPKYEGVRTSRRQLMDEGNDEQIGSGVEESSFNSGEEGSEFEDEGAAGFDGSGEEDEEGSSEEGPSESEEGEQEGGDSEEERPQPQLAKLSYSKRPAEAEPVEDISSTLRKTREEDRNKGKSVSRQIALWDSLLDARIRLQKSVTTANKLPLPSEIEQYLALPECRESMTKLLDESLALVDELFELEEILMTKNETVTPPPRKRRKMEANSTFADYSVAFEGVTEDAALLEQTFHPYLLQTLSKWSSKVQAVAPSVLLPSNRGAFSKGSQHLKSAVQLIEESLADHDKLVGKTQVRRGKVPRIGIVAENEDEDKVDAEIFDDTDFYQKMLRDIIDSRNGGTGQEDWMVLQKQKKAKKKVDTKASKGRKLRYEVHEKIQNFMVPVPMAGAWHDEQIDELFSSLLGKGFEGSGVNDNPEETEQVIDLGDTLKGGFRVFG
ncbi:apoptosis-antagonizing transcription factor [Crucibulum laeve]|uniref:Protein BFR2 n=1 Tax=Crucibulum laeve TaxID=68775 RepID=A0A5C3M1Z5_9AGAR|nr:apoptosis-antagonizing transcription factor [Crucibulum laeve]